MDLNLTPDIADKVNSLEKDPSKENAEKLFGQENVNEGFTQCKICKKRIPLSKIRIVNTSLLKGALMPVCDDCMELIDKNKLIKFFCLKCKELFTVKEPTGKPDVKTGFKMLAGNSYHITRCPNCDRQFFEDHPVVELRTIEELTYIHKQSTIKPVNY